MGPGLIESVSVGMIRPSHVSSQPPIPPEGEGGGEGTCPKVVSTVKLAQKQCMSIIVAGE